ncbi:hypothetical protein H3J60_004567 [Salmonella enterica]|nr:hypothetical protein [Salmonella enterica]
MTINTQELALMAGITESELVHALLSEGYLFGVKIPVPVGRGGSRTRAFRYTEAMLFANSVKSARRTSGR